MTRFISYLSFFKKSDILGSFLRACIYTIGHIFIAMTCNILITGTSVDLAILDAIIEPLINGVWYFTLDRFWQKIKK